MKAPDPGTLPDIGTAPDPGTALRELRAQGLTPEDVRRMVGL